MSELLPAPFGPRSPNMPVPIVSETLSRARTPFAYVLERPEIVSATSASAAEGLGGARGEAGGGGAELGAPAKRAQGLARCLSRQNGAGNPMLSGAIEW